MHSFFDLNPQQRNTLLAGFKHGGLHITSTQQQIHLNGGGTFAAEIHAYLQKLISLGGTDDMVKHLLDVTDSVLKDHASVNQDEEENEQTKSSHSELNQSPIRAQIALTAPRSGSDLLSYIDAAKTVVKSAKQSLWISTYSFNHSQLYKIGVNQKPAYLIKSGFKQLFKILEDHPDPKSLELRLMIQLIPEENDPRPLAEMESEVAKALQNAWPDHLPLPVVYHNPTKHSYTGKAKGSQHSKVIIADDSIALIGSANLSDAAYERNIEVGCVIEDQEQVKALQEEFEALIESKKLTRLPLTQPKTLKENATWLDRISSDGLSNASIQLLQSLAQLTLGKSLSTPLLDDDFDLGGYEFDPQIFWIDEKIALYCPPDSMQIVDHSGIKEAQDQIIALTDMGWYAALITSEVDLQLELDKLSNFLTTSLRG